MTRPGWSTCRPATYKVGAHLRFANRALNPLPALTVIASPEADLQSGLQPLGKVNVRLKTLNEGGVIHDRNAIELHRIYIAGPDS